MADTTNKTSQSPVKKTGFFSFIKAVNRISNELLIIGKDYATRFKDSEITAQDYESEMVGKIYELTNKYSGGNVDLEKDIKSKFSDICAKYLKEGIELYVESLQEEGSLTEKVKTTPDVEPEETPVEEPENNEPELEPTEEQAPEQQNNEVNESVSATALESEELLNQVLNSILGIKSDD